MWMSVNGKPPDLGSGYEGSIPFIRTSRSWLLRICDENKICNKYKNGSLIKTLSYVEMQVKNPEHSYFKCNYIFVF